ncbi:hypothetical protein MSAN_01872400 [Mycena sanguinolenta]|uniref:Uncharacterized protein n=1 Tax=Mycena sanguinolenta TaxID=230812 RepID=A0A8H6XU18_9AGAR|nr:hypothetical protein MSAN_01872400 [Mycena sanguinolenta]
MSSALFSSFSAFSSSSKASSTVLWVLGSAIQSLLITFAINTTSTVKTIEATSTIQAVLTPSPCIPVAGSLECPYMAVASYMGVISILVAWILFAKTSTGASTGPCTPPPNPTPPTPDPGPADTSPQSQDSVPLPQAAVAAAGAPPPPPPGNDTTCGNERRPKRTFLSRFLGFIFRIFSIILRTFSIILRIFSIILRIFSIILWIIWWIVWLFIWRPIALASSIALFFLLHCAILPLIVRIIGHTYGVTPVLKPYIYFPTLWWFAVWGLAACICWIINILALALGFIWGMCRAIYLRILRSIESPLRRLRSSLHRFWSQWRLFHEDAWWTSGCLLVLIAGALLLVGYSLVPAAVHHTIYWRERVCEGLTVLFQILCDSEFGIPVVGIASFSMLIRWIFSSERAERAARRNLQKRIEMLEAR